MLSVKRLAAEYGKSILVIVFLLGVLYFLQWEGKDLFSFSRSKASAGSPNVVVIMTDDLSANVTRGAITNGLMPKLRSEIMDKGTTFTKFFISNSVCCPSRATFLNGQYSHNNGVWSNAPPYGGVYPFNDTSTLATWLQSAGFRTGLVGKYLNAYGWDSDPSPVDDPTYIPPGWTDWQAMVSPKSPKEAMYNYTINDNGELVTYGSQSSDYQTDVLAARAVDFIQESDTLNDAQPFFLFLTPTAPHVEVTPHCAINKGSMATIRMAPRHAGRTDTLPFPQSPNYNEADVSDKPVWVNNYPLITPEQTDCFTRIYRDQVGSMLAIDELIGTVVSVLEQTGEIGNTVIMFSSDNGFLLGEHRLNSKQLAYEESIHVPLFIRAPGFSSPQTSKRLTVNTDLAPTILEFAQATAGLAVDGRSLVPLLQSPDRLPWRKQILIETKEVGLSYAGLRTDTISPSTPNELYLEYSNGIKEFYDLNKDPYELTSFHNSQQSPYPAQRQILSTLLSQFKTCGNGTCQVLENQ